MSESIRGNHSHLLLSDRIYIEQELNQGSTFYSIAKVLHKDPTTIQKKLKDPEVLNPHISGGINADFAGTTKPVGNGMYVATTSTANVTKLVVTVTAWIQLSIVSTLFPMFVINQPRLHLCAIPAIITEIVL